MNLRAGVFAFTAIQTDFRNFALDRFAPFDSCEETRKLSLRIDVCVCECLCVSVGTCLCVSVSITHVDTLHPV